MTITINNTEHVVRVLHEWPHILCGRRAKSEAAEVNEGMCVHCKNNGTRACVYIAKIMELSFMACRSSPNPSALPPKWIETMISQHSFTWRITHSFGDDCRHKYCDNSRQEAVILEKKEGEKRSAWRISKCGHHFATNNSSPPFTREREHGILPVQSQGSCP